MNGNHGIPRYTGDLNHRCVTIAQALRAAGYQTWMSGKWALYALRNDRTEIRDQAQQRPGRAAALKLLYERWAARCGVMPWDFERDRPVGQ